MAGPPPFKPELQHLGEEERIGRYAMAGVPQDPGTFTADGWLRTGEVATMDAHGYLRITDRSKDLIKSGGEWISSVDMENLLMAHPAVLEAAVIAVPDRFEFLEAIPRTSTGKCWKMKLREMFRS